MDPISVDPGSLDITAAITAVAALGTAAYGLVDGSKAVRGGASNHGFGFITAALAPFKACLDTLGPAVADATLYANWLNGMPKADQKAGAKALIRLSLTPDTAAAAAVAVHVDPVALELAVRRGTTGEATAQDMNVLGQFDARLSAMLDAGYERADQRYRNAAKAWSVVVAVALAIAGNASIYGWSGRGTAVAVLIGLIATPLAPVAKDLASSLQAAAGALKAVRR